ncbi:MAG: phytanoyl-CoA dioxygenase family protein [Rhodoferax sp.]|nr:phytanoyl-CoA dioxygenase family protein [Rhodoferax sp.]
MSPTQQGPDPAQSDGPHAGVVPRVAGRPIPPHRLGRLREPEHGGFQPQVWQESLARDGYLLLRSVLDPAAVRRARLDVLEQLADAGEIADPVEQGIVSGRSLRAERYPDLGAFWRAVCELPRLRALSHGAGLAGVMGGLLGQPVVPFDFLWLRAITEGRATPLHFDHVYMNRGSSRVCTAWIPLGDVPVEAGPLAVVEGSHRYTDLIERYRGVDVDRHAMPGSFPEDALAFVESRDTRLLTTDFRAGDVLVFGMFTLHGSLDNQWGGGRVRLSCDARWQPLDDARDDRWFGDPPAAHHGQGYGGLNGARPLGAAHRDR